MTSTDSRLARPFGAVGTAMVTPLTEDGHKVDFDAAQKLAAHVVEHGHDMIVVSGTTGEAPTLTDVEKFDLARAVRDAVGPDITVVAGVGTYDTAHSIDLAREHAKLGIDGLLVVTPYYSKPSQAGVISHTTAIADSTDLPVMLYDI
ncbi:MAG: dihydrodipicolinate synthase family protein, partial [Dermabacteraceae bacterium]